MSFFAVLLATVLPASGLEEIAQRVLPDEGDAAAVIDLNNGRLLLEHGSVAEKKIVAGSVMKLFSAYALLEEGLTDREYSCTGGHKDAYGTERACWLRSGHGEVRLTRAIADSCNVWFYSAAESLPPAAFLRVMKSFGIGERWVSDIPNIALDTVPGLIPERDLPDVVVGDALAMEVTPLSLLRAVSVIATRGRRVTPVRGRAPSIEQSELDRGYLDRIAVAMEEAVESGTLSETLRGMDVAAKTGTAKKRGTPKTRGLVLGFAPRKEPRYAFVVVKSEGRGAVDAAPPARMLLESLLGVTPKTSGFVDVQILGKTRPKSLRIGGNCRVDQLKIEKIDLSGDTVAACDARGRCVQNRELKVLCERAQIDGRRYGPQLTIRAEKDELRVVARLDLEEYVAGVVESENAGAPLESKRALATVARTFALYALQERRHTSAPLCDLTHCQAFRETLETRDRRTDGHVLRDGGGQISAVFYHSTCGGRTVDAYGVWPDLSNRWLPGVDDNFCKNSPHARWVYEVSDEKLANALSAIAGKTLDRHNIILERTRDDGTRWKIGDARQTMEVGGEKLHLELARIFGFGAVKSSDFEVLRAGSSFRLRGRGLGHRVGLCQHGANERAAAGHDAGAILSAYFPKLRLTRPPPADRLQVTATRELRHLPLFQAACAAIEAELGTLPQAMRFELVQAATIEEFVKRSRRSPYEAAALAGRTIWLQPDSLLDRYGDLTLIARHECVHAWLRGQRVPPRSPIVEESLALGFAGQTARLTPGKKFAPEELEQAEKLLAAPRNRAELERTLARSVATVWPSAKRLSATALLDALLSRHWTATALGDTLRTRDP
jgi:stage II sporulation protein D